MGYEQKGRDYASMYELQEPATLNQEAPVRNVWYTVLETTERCRVYAFCAAVEDTDETVVMRVTIDDVEWGGAFNFTHSTNYYAYKYSQGIVGTAYWYLKGTETTHQTFIVDGKSVKIEIRKTTDAGVGNLKAICEYGVLKDVY